MSRLMDDLKELNENRKIESGIIIQDADEPKKAPIASDHKTVYFIGFLIVLIVALSSFSMAVSLKTLSRIESVEEETASTSMKILARLKDSEIISASLLESLKKQENELQNLQALITEQNKEELARMDGLKAQVKEVKIAIRDREVELEDLTFAHNTLKSSVEDSIEDLKISNKLMMDKHILLNDKVKKIVDSNMYLYSTY